MQNGLDIFLPAAEHDLHLREPASVNRKGRRCGFHRLTDIPRTGGQHIADHDRDRLSCADSPFHDQMGLRRLMSGKPPARLQRYRERRRKLIIIPCSELAQDDRTIPRLHSARLPIRVRQPHCLDLPLGGRQRPCLIEQK